MAVLCVAGQTYTLEFSLEDQGNAGLWKANPTIAAGDFQISVNGGAFSNVDNIPTVTPAAGRRVALVISAAETTAAGAGGLLYIQGVDAAGDEWYDVGFSVRVVASSGDVAQTGADGDTLETLSDEIAAVDGKVDTILGQTGTSGVVLADDSISASTFDETTAFPQTTEDVEAMVLP